jgi:hypothetical protein
MVAGEEKKTQISVIELYGFFSWNLSAIVFIIYMIWAFVPDSILNSFGIYYIPDKYYAIAIPLWFAVTLFTALQLYVTICMYCTPSIESYETLQDKHTILKNPTIEQEKQEVILQKRVKLENPADAPSVANIQPASKDQNQDKVEERFKQKFSKDKTKIADVFELPITVVNNVLYQSIR